MLALTWRPDVDALLRQCAHVCATASQLVGAMLLMRFYQVETFLTISIWFVNILPKATLFKHNFWQQPDYIVIVD